MLGLFIVIASILTAIAIAGWLLGSLLVGLAVALIMFGVLVFWMGARTPLQLQPLPLIAFMVGFAMLILKFGGFAD